MATRADLELFARRAVPLSLHAFTRYVAEGAELFTTRLARCETEAMAPAATLAMVTRMATAAEWYSDQTAILSTFAPGLIDGGISAFEGWFLYHVVREFKLGRVLEVGTHVGCSTAYIAAGIKTHEEPLFTSVDIIEVNADDGPWRRHGQPMSPAERLPQIDCKGVTFFMERDSLDYMAETEEVFDLIFLDGCHRASHVYREIALATQRLSPGGVIVLHDHFPDAGPLTTDRKVIPGPALALRRIESENPSLQAIPLRSLPWQSAPPYKSTMTMLGRR